LCSHPNFFWQDGVFVRRPPGPACYPDRIPAKLWNDIRQQLDKRRVHALTLTVDEIRSMTGTEQNIDKVWWWELVDKKTAVEPEPWEP
jgi:hypothetical protein